MLQIFLNFFIAPGFPTFSFTFEPGKQNTSIICCKKLFNETLEKNNISQSINLVVTLTVESFFTTIDSIFFEFISL